MKKKFESTFFFLQEEMEQCDKDAFLLIIWNLEPADVLAIRATCKTLNDRVKNAQIYWYYKFRRFEAIAKNDKRTEVTEFTGRRVVHVKPYDWSCINYSNMSSYQIFELMCVHHPDAELDRTRAELINKRQGLPAHVHVMWREINQAVYARKHLLKELPGFSCNKWNHITTIYDDASTSRVQHGEMGEDEGLYMWHYLFACYHQKKKLLQRHVAKNRNINAVTDGAAGEAKRKDNIALLKSKLVVIERDRRDVMMQIALMEKYNTLVADMNDCPFNRKNPATYETKNQSSSSATKRRKKTQ